MTSISISQLTPCCKLPSQLKNKYTIAIAMRNTVVLYSLNNYTLESIKTGIKLTVKYCIHVEKVKFAENNKLIMVGNTGVIEIK